MPEEFTPEEQKLLAEAPADSATMIGEDLSDDQDQAQERPDAAEEPPAGSQA